MPHLSTGSRYPSVALNKASANPAMPKWLLDDSLLRWSALTLLGYWLTYALVAPVTVWDSQTYNVARLYIAHAGGLFGNQGWNDSRQISFPWTFDAIHYPFLFLGGGYCLPSFACSVGLLMIVYRMVAFRISTRGAWWCCLALLSLPTFVFQAVSTKNDLAVVFAVGCWFYAVWLWRQEPRYGYVVFMAAALGFAAGAKSSGVPLFGLLGLYSVWMLRDQRRLVAHFAGWLTVAFVLLGSVEIYLNNQLIYGFPLGPFTFVKQHSNNDGLPGAVANFIRYCFGTIDIGVDVANRTSPAPAWFETGCRTFLRLVGLNNVGYRNDFNDQNLCFLRGGFESASTYGPIGSVALIACLIFVFTRPLSDPIWKLAATGLASLSLVAYTVAWMPWNTRFLMLPFCLFTLALTLWILRSNEDTGRKRFLSSAYFVAILFSATVFPLNSFNKNPASLWLAIRDRPRLEAQERIGMLEIVRDLRARSSTLRPGVLMLCAGGDSWVLSILEIRDLHVIPSPTLDAQTLLAASRNSSRNSSGKEPVYVLALNRQLEPSLLEHMTEVKRYAETDSALYKWLPSTEAESSH